MKKRFVLVLAAWFAFFSIVPVSSVLADEQATRASAGSTTVSFDVWQEDSEEISAAGRYIDETATIIVEEEKTYAILTLKSANWWHSMHTQTAQPGTFEEDNFVEAEVLSENEEENTRTVKFYVPDMNEVLNAKVRIIVTGVPGVGEYDHTYNIRLKFHAEQQSEATDAANEEVSGEENAAVTEEADQEAVEEAAGTEVADLEDGRYTIGFQALHEKEDKPSSMTRYIEAPASLIVEDGVQYVVFTLTNNEQITAFQVEADGEFIDAEVRSVDEQANTRDVAFAVEDFSAVLNAKVQVYVAAQNYTGNHVVRLAFDQASIEPVVEAPAVLFEDIETSWAKSYIEDLASRDIIQGVSEQRFAPEDSITRAQFAVLLARTLDLPKEAYAGVFSDVTEELAWAVYEIEAANRAGIVEGHDGEFDPHALITREQMVTMVVRALAYTDGAILAQDTQPVTFADEATIQAYAKEHVAQAVGLGIINGIEANGETLFAPGADATRAQAAKVIYQMLEIL